MKLAAMTSLLLTIIVIAFISTISGVHSLQPKSINVGVKATWSTTSILAEASEFYASHSNELYWQFVNGVADHIAAGHGVTTQRAEYDLALTLAAKLSGNATLDVLRYSLAIRYYSPKVEMFAQLSRTHIADIVRDHPSDVDVNSCATLLTYDNTVACGVRDSTFTTATFDEEIFEFDHLFVGPSAPVTVILYADLASPSFASVHQQLVALATRGTIRYVIRPRAVGDGSNSAAAVGPLSLQGFGVELALKNMEYKVLDDQKISVDLGGAVDLEILDEAGGAETDVNGFLFNKLKDRRPDLETELNQFRADLLSRADDTKAINVWELKDLGFQAVQRILQSSDSLVLLRELSQNFPMYASALTKTRTNTTLKNGMMQAGERQGMHPGLNSLHINGVALNIDEVDIFALQAVLHREASTMDQLKGLRLSAPDIRKLVSIPATVSGEQGSQADSSLFRIDMDIDGLAKSTVTFMNDIPVDRRYVSWPPSVQELLAPGWPNQLRYVRKNLYTAVIVLDPTTIEGLNMFSRARYFVNGNAPIRVGIAFFIPQESATSSKWNDDLLPRDSWKDLISEHDTTTGGKSVAAKGTPSDSTQAIVAKLFKHIHEQSTAEKAFDFLQSLLDTNEELTDKEPTIRAAFIKFWKKNGSSKKDGKDVYNEVLESDDGRTFITKSQTYVHSRGFKPDPFPCMVVNGIIHRGSNEVQFRELMMHAILSEQHGMMMRVYRREITDTTNIPAYFASQPFTYPGGSEHVLQSGKDQKFAVSLPASPREGVASLVYFHHEDKEYQVKGVTYIIAADLATKSGVDLVAAAITHATTIHPGHDSRIAVIPNPASLTATNELGRIVAAVIQHLKPKKAFTIIRRLIAAAQYFSASEERQLRAYRRIVTDEPKLPASVLDIFNGAASSNEWLSGGQGIAADYVTRSLGVAAGTSVVLANGRIITMPTHLTYHQMVADFKLMDLFEYRFQNAKKVLDIVEHTTYVDVAIEEISSEYMTEVAQRVTYALAKRAAASAATGSQGPNNNGGGMPAPVFDVNDAHVLKYHSPTSLTDVVVVLDPLSKQAQRLTPMLIALRDGLDCSISVYLNPLRELGEFPLKRFYRYAVSSSLLFDDNGAVKPAVGAVFRQLHTDKVLTMGISTPESWLVAATVAHYDLDNIRLTDMTDVDTMHVTYTLEKLLISGQCLDTTVREHPAGLQVVLGTTSETSMHDTIVMQNLGYFQLQTRPGVWQLRVARGRPSEIYAFESTKAATIRYRPNETIKRANTPDAILQMNSDTHSREPFISWPVMTFHDTFTRLSMKRKPGQELAKLEQENSAAAGGSGGIWNSLFGSKPEHTSNETIHIFSLASGHLYERFLKIMMLSVVKNTKSPVKFWFLKNFLSPQFKEFVPQMAAHYGFEVELMTYKWPSWLRQQEEKQRIIWGYKILFLDVLFPLKLRRVIYVDADQVVRGDVKELWDRDLGGAPYAYTPFCESNKENDGFRFWNQGYWRDHLRGRPYHISALYIVDLDRFRASRAGDSLRMMYDNLSADKNSLANLDQDLPNYAQHMVPIHSLPMEWLWCQTWCSMDTLASAKTIDLCNNPNTKTPKLEVAKALLAEWPGLDNEARSLDPIFAARRTETDDKAAKQRGYETDALRAARQTRDL